MMNQFAPWTGVALLCLCFACQTRLEAGRLDFSRQIVSFTTSAFGDGGQGYWQGPFYCGGAYHDQTPGDWFDAHVRPRTDVDRWYDHGGIVADPRDVGECPNPSRVDPPSARASSPHVRSTDPALATLIRVAERRSPTFLSVVRALDASDLIVYVSRGTCGHDDAAGCLLPVVTAVLGARYVFVIISEALADRQQDAIVVLGHELSHAHEVAEAPWVKSFTDFEALYVAIGTECTRSSTICYETAGALATGRQISVELASSSRVPRE